MLYNLCSIQAVDAFAWRPQMQTPDIEQERSQPRIFYGWWIVAVGTVMRTVFATFSYYGFSAFFNPLVEQFGWSRAALAGVLSLSRLEGGFMALPAGYLFDRIGPRKMMFIGITLTGVGYILLSRTTSLVYFYMIMILMVQLGASFGMGGGAVDVAIANWFRRKRSRAMGIGTLGLSFGGIMVIPLTLLISQYGWRSGILVAGLATLCLGYPLASIVRHRPEPYGYLPDGDPPRRRASVQDTGPPENATAPEPPASAAQAPAAQPAGQAAQDDDDEETNFSPLQALKVRAFYAVAFTFAARQLVSGTIAVFLIPFLQERGMSLTQAGMVLGVMALIGAPGRVIFAWLGDIFPKRFVMAGCFSIQSVGLILFAYVDGMTGIIFFLTLYAPTYAGVLPLIPAIQAEYFGRKWFGTIRGMMTPITLISGVIGPIFAGTVRDVTGSYRLAFTVLAFSILLALALILSARPPKAPE